MSFTQAVMLTRKTIGQSLSNLYCSPFLFKMCQWLLICLHTPAAFFKNTSLQIICDHDTRITQGTIMFLFATHYLSV